MAGILTGAVGFCEGAFQLAWEQAAPLPGWELALSCRPLSWLARALASRGCRLRGTRSATIFGPSPAFGPLASLTCLWKNLPCQSKPDSIFSPVEIHKGSAAQVCCFQSPHGEAWDSVVLNVDSDVVSSTSKARMWSWSGIQILFQVFF